MLTFEKILRMAAEIDEVCSEIHVSPLIGEQLAKRGTNYGIRKESFELPVIIDCFYAPDWWSEHYRDRIVLHTEKGEVAIPNIRLPIRPFRFKEFEIVMPPKPAEGKTQE